MTEMNREAILNKIRSSIDAKGYHLRLVDGGPSPRFCYTIGYKAKLGYEFIFPGGLFYGVEDVKEIFRGISNEINQGDLLVSKFFECAGLGSFQIDEVDRSWTERMLLGALDYYNCEHIKTYQIRPDPQHWTVDVPKMRRPWSPNQEPIWKWLECPWSFPVPSNSMAVTNLKALRGEDVTEVVRWEEAEWEIFSGPGPDVVQTDIRVVPLGVLIGHDPSLLPALDLSKGMGLWRNDRSSEWNSWVRR